MQIMNYVTYNSFQNWLYIRTTKGDSQNTWALSQNQSLQHGDLESACFNRFPNVFYSAILSLTSSLQDL